MKLQRNSWHYRLFLWTDDRLNPRSFEEPRNLCAYVQALAKNTAMCALFGTAFAVCVTVMAICVSVPWLIILLLIGRRPVAIESEPPLFATYEKYAPLRIGRLRLYPWHALIPVALYGAVRIIVAHPKIALEFVSVGLGTPVVLYGLWRAFVYLFEDDGFRKSDTYRIVKGYVSAKTNGWCPSVEFEGEPPRKEKS